VEAEKLLDRVSLKKGLEEFGVPSLMPEPGEDPLTLLLPELKSGDLLLICSSGDFGNIHERALAALRARAGDSA